MKPSSIDYLRRLRKMTRGMFKPPLDWPLNLKRFSEGGISRIR
jgi:hypothetical protein